jgi:hypothetical protein
MNSGGSTDAALAAKSARAGPASGAIREYEILIHMRTAKALELSLPLAFLARADEVIE